MCGNLLDAFTKISSSGDQSAATPINSSSASFSGSQSNSRLVQNSPQPGTSPISTTDYDVRLSGPHTSRDSLRDVRSSANSLQTMCGSSQHSMPRPINEVCNPGM